eukprot:scaffold494_cov245-Pinguiococcus_pyrenoidosus.AAC.21
MKGDEDTGASWFFRDLQLSAEAAARYSPSVASPRNEAPTSTTTSTAISAPARSICWSLIFLIRKTRPRPSFSNEKKRFFFGPNTIPPIGPGVDPAVS